MSAGWYYKLMGEEIGPLSTGELRQHALDGKVTAEIYVRREDSDRWVAATGIKGLLDPPHARERPPTEPEKPKPPPIPIETPTFTPQPRAPATKTKRSVVSLILVSLAAALFVGFFCYSKYSKTLTANPLFRDQLLKFLTISGELEALTGQGVSQATFASQFAKVKTSYELVSATWPTGFAPTAHYSFDRAIEGWGLALVMDKDPETYTARYDSYMLYKFNDASPGTRANALNGERTIGNLLFVASSHH